MAEKRQPKEDKPPPKCKAILLCESIMREEGTRKTSLIRLMNSQTIRIPGRTKPMTLFLHLVDGIGDYDVTVFVHDLAEDQVVFRVKGRKIAFPDRFSPVRVSCVLPGLPIRRAGRYDVVVLGNGQEIERQQFVVKQWEEEGGTP